MSNELDTHMVVDKGSDLKITANCSTDDVILRGRFKYDGHDPSSIPHDELFNTTCTLPMSTTGVDATLRLFARFNGDPTQVEINIEGVSDSEPVSVTGILEGGDGDTEMGVIDLFIE